MGAVRAAPQPPPAGLPPPAAADGAGAGAGWALRHLIGVDISETALVRAQKTLQVQPPPALPSPGWPAKQVQLSSRTRPHRAGAGAGGGDGCRRCPLAAPPGSAGVRGGRVPLGRRRRSRRGRGEGFIFFARPRATLIQDHICHATPGAPPRCSFLRCTHRPSEAEGLRPQGGPPRIQGQLFSHLRLAYRVIGRRRHT